MWYARTCEDGMCGALDCVACRGLDALEWMGGERPDEVALCDVDPELRDAYPPLDDLVVDDISHEEVANDE